MVRIFGNMSAHGAAGVIVHASWFGAGVTQVGGGTAESCDVPETGVWAALQSPPFSDYEDNTIQGNLSVRGVSSRWFGALRNSVSGNMSVQGSRMADPDANEVLTNRVGAISPARATIRSSIRRLVGQSEPGQRQRQRGMRVQRAAAGPGTEQATHADQCGAYAGGSEPRVHVRGLNAAI